LKLGGNFELFLIPKATPLGQGMAGASKCFYALCRITRTHQLTTYLQNHILPFPANLWVKAHIFT